MNTFDVGAVFPVHGPTGQLLAAAIASPVPQSLTKLGETAGLSKFAASRAGRQLQEAGLLVPAEDGRGYRFNTDHALADLAMTVVRVVQGVIPREQLSRAEIRDAQTDDMAYLDDLPEQSRLPGPPAADRQPSLVTAVDARVVLEQLAVLMERVLEPEELGQAMYSQWGSQRARDVVHQTLHLGHATAAARRTLLAETSARRPAPEPSVSTWAWSRATYLVRAEQLRLERGAGLFEQAVEFGGRFQGRREQLLDEAVLIARRRELPDEDQLQRMTERYEDIEQMWKTSMRSLHNVGGATAPRDVGATGDQVLAIMLRRLAGCYSDLAHRMDQLAGTATTE